MWKCCKLGWGDNANKNEFGGYFKICKMMYTLPLVGVGVYINIYDYIFIVG